MSTDSFVTISSISEGTYKNKGSKFYAFAHPIHEQKEVKELVKFYRKKYYDARHHCYAYVFGEQNEHFRAADDGEPSNSAGNPILNQIKSAGLSNVFIMVVRYFGGTKLGVPGLIEAYGSSAKDAILNANLAEKNIERILTISFGYEEMNTVMKVVKQFDLKIKSQSFTDCLNYSLSVRLSNLEQVQTLLKEYLPKT